MTEPSILAEDLTYRFRDDLAVDRISFAVAPGEILGLLGPNGAGKSTTVQMLTGQRRPQQGRATVLGMNVAEQAKAIQARIGVCFEITNHYEQLSGADNLALFARLFDVPDFDPKPLLSRVGLDGRGEDAVERYSKGMKQRLMVARSLVNQPEILFLDEPTEGLDPASAASIRALIEAERQRGATVFLTTHDMHEADKLCDRVAFINQGRIVAIDTPHQLKQQHGQRQIRAQVIGADGELALRRLPLDQPGTPDEISRLFRQEQVVTVHTEEASLEDIFIKLTGRSLV